MEKARKITKSMPKKSPLVHIESLRIVKNLFHFAFKSYDMTRIYIAVSLTLVTLLLIGCAVTTCHVIPQNPTGIEPNEAVSFVLNKYVDDKLSKKPLSSESKWKETYYESCLQRAMREKMPDIRIVTATEFRDLAFPNRSFIDTPRSPQSLIPYFKSAQFQERIAPLRIRYLIILDIEDSTYGRHTEVAIGYDFPPLWAIGQEWQRSVQIEAVVFDIKEGWESGQVTSSSTGKPGMLFLSVYAYHYSLYHTRQPKDLGPVMSWVRLWRYLSLAGIKLNHFLSKS